MTSVIESQIVTATNMAARTYARASGLSWCEHMKVLELCLQNDVEAKIQINLDKLSSVLWKS